MEIDNVLHKTTASTVSPIGNPTFHLMLFADVNYSHTVSIVEVLIWPVIRKVILR